MVGTINYAMEDLQHRILDFSKYCSLHCHIKIEKEREKRKDSDSRGNSADTSNSFIISSSRLFLCVYFYVHAHIIGVSRKSLATSRELH